MIKSVFSYDVQVLVPNSNTPSCFYDYFTKKVFMVIYYV
jgi:hypothetical protein